MTTVIATSVEANQQEPQKVNLLGLPMAAMEQFFLDLGEKKFRAQQVLKWIHHHGVSDIGEMTNLGVALREKLQAIAEVRPPEIVSQHDSADGTRKWVFDRGLPSLSVRGNASPVGSNGTTFIGYDDGKLVALRDLDGLDRKSTRLNSSH